MWFLELTAPLRFSSAEKTARLLMAFARAERSSFFDMMAAAEASPDPARRAAYLRHACDEARHAVMFSARATELAPSIGADPREQRADFEHLYERLGEETFVAFVLLGEMSGFSRLSRYAQELGQRGDEKSRGILHAILQDEERHVRYSSALLDGFGMRQKSIRKARLWSTGRSWLRAGNFVSRTVFTVGMSLIYLLLAPLGLFEKRR